MNLAVSARPKPLPTEYMTRQEAATGPLALVTARDDKGVYPISLSSVPLMTTALFGSERKWKRAMSSIEKVIEFTGTFNDAVTAANQLARSSSGSNVVAGRHAHAVIAAAEGRWLITALGQGRNIGVIDQGTPGSSSIVEDVAAAHPAVKAVVGGGTWVDLSGK